jgi:hypothetical protein
MRQRLPLLVALLAAVVTVATATASAQTPARDTGPAGAGTGTAAIRGRVVDLQAGTPLRRVRVNVTAPGLPREGISTSTDINGDYELAELPGGRFTLRVERGGYLPLQYGQRRPLEQGKPLELAAGQILENINFALPRMSVISGRITDELGEPIAGVTVTAQRSMWFDNRRRLMPDGPIATTDEDGKYRIGGLAPGTYVIHSRSMDKWSAQVAGREQMMSYAPTFFPGLTDASQASKVTVGIGQETGNIDFALTPGRAAKISGTALDSQGRPLRNVSLVLEVMGTSGGRVGSAGSGVVGADGRFEIVGVPPGDYKLQAAGGDELVVQPIVMNGVDLENVALRASGGWSAKGAVVIDSSAPAALRRNQVSLTAVSLAGRNLLGMQGAPVLRSTVADDWTFSVSGVVGAARLRVNIPDGWAVKALQQAGRDIADLPLDLKSGEEIAGLELVLTDRAAALTGQLVDAKGASADGTVLLFPADSSKWYEGSRFVRAARPDQQGRYRLTGILPGEYLAVAVDFAEQGIWNDPEYLASLQQRAQKVSLSEAAASSLTLRVVVP